MGVKLCPITKHTWVKKRTREVCTTCGTSFPCKNRDCEHLDCMYVRGQPIDDYWFELFDAMGVGMDFEQLDKIRNGLEDEDDDDSDAGAE